MVVIGDVLVDRGNQFWNATESAAPNALVSDLAEPTLDPIQPGTRSWGEMQVKSRVTAQPGFDARMFMSAVIINDQMQFEFSGCLTVDPFEKADELYQPA